MDDRGDYNSSFALRAVELKGILHIKVFKIATRYFNISKPKQLTLFLYNLNVFVQKNIRKSITYVR